MKTGKLLTGLLVAGFAGASHAVSVDTLVGDAIEAKVPTPAVDSTFDFNDDSVANVFIDGVRTAEFTALDIATASSMSVEGLFEIYTISTSGGTVVLSSFELTGSYTLDFAGINGAGNAIFDASLSIYEDDTPEAEFLASGNVSSSADFVDGDLFASLTGVFEFDLSFDGSGFFNQAVLVGEAPLTITGGDILDDTYFFNSGYYVDIAAFNIQIDPSTSASPDYDFVDEATFQATVIPAPAAAGAGLLGLVGLVSRRRRQA